MQEKKRLLLRSGAQPRVDGLPRRIRSDELRVDAFPDQDLLKKLRAFGLIARRVRCIDPQVRDESILGFVIDRILLGRGRALTMEE